MKTLPVLFLLTTGLHAHTWNASDDPVEREALREHILEEWTSKRGISAPSDESASGQEWPGYLRIASTASSLQLAATAVANAANTPQAAKAFLPFTRLDLRADGEFLYVGSNGMPDHNMMVGITAWQQQVPLPQSYFGENAWRIPLKPVPAKEPAMINGRFLRGAIALAVNGIPIFNPQNNRGEVSYEIGELDQWGGHCGRADDYHYHITPLHLQAQAGKDMPVAYALDGYPIYGLTEPDGSPVGQLDECHGHEAAGGYHYHASMKYPYVIGGFHGEVVEADGQVDPQPRAQGVREALQALRGAEISDFESTGKTSYKLSYTVNGDKRSISYSIHADGTYPFEFDNGREGTVKEVYTARKGGGGGPPRGPEGKARGKGKGKGGREGVTGAFLPREDNDGPGMARLPTQAPPPAPAGGKDKGKGNVRPSNGLVKPSLADTMKLNVYADNWFMLYVNGRLVAVDSIQFTLHNVVSVDFLPEYPMTIAVLAKDNADPKTGMEYGTSIGEGGFILKFGDGTVTNASWKAKNFIHGPINGDTTNPQVIQEPLPANWWFVDFDDSTWKTAKEFTVEEVDPKQPWFENDFEGAKFIWTDDLALDNTVIFRATIEKSGWTPRWNTKPDLDVTEAPLK
ncbi:MAG TPA: YHYH protein [Prosthecobacter sp.]|nr:YHYH protein [Prosthecobacter sp.]